MSAAFCVVFIGIRHEVDVKDIDSLESRCDARLVAARSARLDTYWWGPHDDDPRGALLIGSRVGVFGPEDQQRVALEGTQLLSRFEETRQRLLNAGFDGPLSLHVEWMND